MDTSKIKTERKNGRKYKKAESIIQSDRNIVNNCAENSESTSESQTDNSIKIYDIERLRAFGDVPFIIKRMEQQDLCISYRHAISSVEEIMERLIKIGVPVGIGITFRMADHTPSSCILILAILNYKCHFYCVDKMTLSQALHEKMCCAGMDYLIVNGHMPVGATYFESLETFLVLNEEYKLCKLKHSRGNPSMQAKYSLPSNMCYTTTTTGTTGLPKLIYVPYECIAPNIVGLSQKLKISMADLIYLGTSCTFDPCVVELFLALYNGAAVLLSHHLMSDSPKRVLRALFPNNVTTPGITILQMTPSLFRQFGSLAIRERILNSSSSLRVLLLGGEQFPSKTELAQWLDPEILNQKKICNIYGITEMSCWSLIHVIKSLDSDIPLGTSIDESTVFRIFNKSTRNTQNVVQGELWLGSSTRRCYIPNTDDMENLHNFKSAVCYRRTGDIVRRFENGDIVYEARANDIVKRAGARISLGLITRKIQNCLNDNEHAACLWLDELQKLTCCIRSFEQKTKVQQRAQTFDILSKLMLVEQPDRFVYLQNFPCNKHGKLDKELLLKECALLAQPAQNILKSYLQDRLGAEVRQEIPAKQQRLDKKLVGYDLSFRHAGGTSFHAITLCREIGLQMCIDDEQRHLFEMLLDENISLRNVLSFLNDAKLVTHNTKIKTLDKNSSTCLNSHGSTTNRALILTRFQKAPKPFDFYWKANFNKCIDSPVAQYENRYVCVGAHSKLLRTLDALTGQEQSRVKLPDRIECKVTFLSTQLAVVGCYDGCLYGFNPLTGDISWNVRIGGIIKSQPFLSSDGSRILVCSYADQYNVMCLSTKQQHVLWCIRVGKKAIFASPLELNKQQAVIICSLDGVYTRVSLLDGSVKWMQRCKEPFFASPVLLDSSASIFFCAEVTGHVHACDVTSGKILKTHAAEGNIFSSLLVKAPPPGRMGNAFLLFGCIDHHMYCLRCNTNSSKSFSFELIWKVNVGSPIYATPTILNNSLLFCCATNGRVVIVNMDHGYIQYSDKLAGELFSTACFVKSLRRIYVGCRDNFLYCIGF